MRGYNFSMEGTTDWHRQADLETRQHHALGAASRARILEVLRAAPQGLDARQIAAQVGLHHNTVRTHLDLLVDAGLAIRHAEERSQPGRPRMVFEAKETDQESQPRGYQLLAQILASYLAGSLADPSAEAEKLGKLWGSYLTVRPPPFERISQDEAMSRLVDRFVDLGFEPEMTRGEAGLKMLLHRCPFRELAAERPQVVCSLHLGLMRGVLSELGSSVEATTLLPFVQPSLCVAHLK